MTFQHLSNPETQVRKGAARWRRGGDMEGGAGPSAHSPSPCNCGNRAGSSLEQVERGILRQGSVRLGWGPGAGGPSLLTWLFWKLERLKGGIHTLPDRSLSLTLLSIPRCPNGSPSSCPGGPEGAPSPPQLVLCRHRGSGGRGWGAPPPPDPGGNCPGTQDQAKWAQSCPRPPPTPAARRSPPA